MNEPGPALFLLQIGALLALIVTLSGCSGYSETSQALPPYTPHPLELEFHDRINRYRVSIGKKALAFDHVLSAYARAHSVDMSKGRVRFGHDGFTQRAAAIRSRRPVFRVTENVAASNGFDDAIAAAIVELLKSPEHKRNLEGAFVLSGVGVTKSSDGTYFFTQIFADYGEPLR